MARKRRLPDGMQERGGVYYARFRRDGTLVRKKLSKDFRAACELLRDLQVKADKGDLGIGNKVMLTEIRDRWLKHCDQTLRPSTVTRYRENIRNVFSGLSARTVKQLSPEQIIDYRADRLGDVLNPQGENPKTVSPRTINQEVGALSTMLNWAMSTRGGRLTSDTLRSR